MSWRQQQDNGSKQFNPHGGRNAFRGTDEDDMDSSSAERAASFRAMRSFTQSIECDDLPSAPELPPELDIDHIEGMKSSDTNDTIIEVIKPSKPDVDPQLGETQKYKMAVPGPGHSEQEHELHKSLIQDEDDEADNEIEMVMAESRHNNNKKEKSGPPSAFSKNVQDSDYLAMRKESLNSAIQRRRPTTPTSQCTLETIAFVSAVEPPEVKNNEKIKVSIPASRRRKSEMSYSDFYDNMAQQIPAQSKGTYSGRTTPINDYDGDILEEDPVYKNKAPPAPVVHRRSSMDWENFEEIKDRMEIVPDATADNQKKAPSMEDEEPTFSEEMQAERLKIKKSRKSSSQNQVATPTSTPVHEKPTEVTNTEASSSEPPVTQPEVTTEVVQPEVVAPEEQVVPTVVASEPSEVQPVEGEASAGGESTYDPNAYPGYIWNYEKQEWEVDPNYTGEVYDYSQQQDTTGYDQYYQGYDQNPTSDQPTTVYDYTTAALHVGYDQKTDYQNSYQQPTQDYQDPSSQSYYPSTDYNQTYQSDQYPSTGYQDSSYQDTTYNNTYPSTAYQDPAYNQSYQTTEGYQYPSETPADGAYQQYQDPSARGYDPAHVGYDQPYDATTAYDYTTAAYHQGYDQGEASGYSEQPFQAADTYQAPTDSYQAPDTAYQPETHQDLPYQPPADTYQPPVEQEPVEEHHAPPPPRPPVYTVPLYKPNDPYAWNEEETPAEPAPPPRPAAPPARPPPASHPVQEPTEHASPPSRPPPAARPPPPRPNVPHPANLPDKEEDAWAAFKKLTEKVGDVVKTTEEQLKNLSETSAANDIKDESYLSQIGGEQGYVHNGTQREIQKKLEEQKNAKILKKKLKQQGKKAASPTFDPDEEDNMDKAAQELAAKMAAKMGLTLPQPTPPPAPQVEKVVKEHESVERNDSLSAIPPRKRSSLKEVQQDSGGSLELPAHLNMQQRDSIAPKGDLDPNDPVLSAPAWADFDAVEAPLPPSESGFFSSKIEAPAPEQEDAPAPVTIDPFAPQDKTLIDEDYDPFAIQPVEDIIATAKAKAEQVQLACQGGEDVDFFSAGRHSPVSTPTPEGGSPLSHRPQGFEDEFKLDNMGEETPTPLYDEDDSEPLTDFIPKFSGDGWELMIRHPIKKKSFMAERCWKPCYVRIRDNTLLVFNSRNDNKPIQELLLQATYSLSDTTLQAYDIYGKIHTVKLQYVLYKEKLGIRPGQISRLVEGHVTKYGLPLEHSAQCNVLLKFGSLQAAELQSFVMTIEDILFGCPCKRETKPVYKQDEVQVHCYDEYSAFVDKEGIVSDQRARVRLFCLAFVTGSPFLEIGLNDRRRQGKEIVRRKDILPMYTERWIRFENLEFHNTVDRNEFDKEQVIRLSPPDGCFFEIMRFRVRPPKNREKALNIKSIMKIAGSKVEIRLEVMAAAQVERSRGGKSTRRQIPCEDIAIRFPIPEAWIYIFREERHWGVGSVHSKKLRPGKVKNLKDRLLGAVQSNDPNLIEVAIGEAKYEHVYRALVWRIPRLPEKHHAAYKSHLLKCRFELSSFDLMPETFLPRCEVDFTMPLATVSNTVVRSVSVEQHEDSDRVEKFVRYVAKCQYKVEIDYVQCADLEVDTLNPGLNPEEAMNTIPELHKPEFDMDAISDLQTGYGIEHNNHNNQSEVKQDFSRNPNDSSSEDDDDDKPNKMPIIQIDMKNYGY